MRYFFIGVFVLFVLCLPYSWSQSEPPQARHAPEPALGALSVNSQEGLVQADLPYSAPLSPPGIVTRDRATLELGVESQRTNTITGSLGIVIGYDDNIALTSGSGPSDVRYLVAPGIDMRRSTDRWLWALTYYPGFSVSQRFDQRNESSQNLNLDTTYFVTQHVSLRLRDSFEKTNSLFSDYLGGQQGPAPLPPLNNFVVTPLSQRTSNSSSVDVNYRISEGTLVGAGSTYSFLNYGDVSGTTGVTPSLIDTQTSSAQGFYAHRFSNNHWTGAVYNFQHFSFAPGERVDVHRVLYFYSLPLRSDMSLSLWAGPQYSNTGITSFVPSAPGATVPSHAQWSGAGGVAYVWQGRLTSLAASYSRLISDGGGLAEAVMLQDVSAEFRRRLSASWTASAGMFYSDANPTYETLAGYGQTHTISATAGLERRFSERLSARLSYVRDRLEYGSPGSGITPIHRNQLLFSLSYSFTRPWGR